MNKEIRVLHIRSSDWLRCESGRSGPQLHSLFSELSYRVQPSDSNECWLWPLVFGYSEHKVALMSMCACGFHLRICMWCPLALLFVFFGVFFPLFAQIWRRQSEPRGTVNGRWFMCYSNQTHRQRWMFTEAGGAADLTLSRCDREGRAQRRKKRRRRRIETWARPQRSGCTTGGYNDTRQWQSVLSPGRWQFWSCYTHRV